MSSISTLSDKELKALYQSEDSSTPISKLSDDELKSLYLPETKEQAKSLSELKSNFPQNITKDLKNTPIETAGVMGASAIQGAADFAGDAGSFLTEMIGKVSPKLQTALNSVGKKIKDNIGTPELAEAQERNPITTAISKGAGYTAGAFGMGRALPSAGIPGVISQGALGSAMAGEGNRLAGAAGGAIIPAALSSAAVKTLGSPAAFITSNASLQKDIQNIRTSINKPVNPEYKGLGINAATNVAFSKFRAVPGEISAIRPVAAIDDFINNNNSVLSTKQTKILQDLKTDISNAKTLEELHNARKSFTKDYGNVFLSGNDKLVGKSRMAIEEVKKGIENNLQMNARKLGALDKYTEANTLYKQSLEARIINQAFKKIETKSGGQDLNNFTNTIKNLKTELKNQLSPETAQVLLGIQNTAREANHFLGLNINKDIVGGLGNVPLKILQSMTKIPLLNSLLRKAGTPQGRAIAKELGKTIINIGQAKGLAPKLESFIAQEETE